jgi:hypothetical protein
MFTGMQPALRSPGKHIPVIGRRVHFCKIRLQRKDEGYRFCSQSAEMIGTVPGITYRLHVICIIFSVVVSDFLEHLVDSPFIQGPLPLMLDACRHRELTN